MATKLTKPISRETAKTYKNKPVIVTLAPLGGQSEARIGFRLAGERRQYVALVSDLYRVAALWHGNKEAAAKRAARKMGVPWRRAKKQFDRDNGIAKYVAPLKLPDELPLTPEPTTH